jgi:tetratricopeptide (TPR) repeat protein
MEQRRLMTYAATQLFVERATAVRPDFAINGANAAAIAAICTRLDGLPLAIELAAARMRVLTPEALLPRLTTALNVLTGGGRDLPDRHQTLRATIASSYDALEAPERELLDRLSVFAGGFELAAAELVCAVTFASGPGVVILDALASLVEKSLVRVMPSDSGLRYSLLVSIREYAAEMLAAREEAGELRRRHAEYYADDPDVMPNREVDNLRTGLDHALEADADLAGRLSRRLAQALVEGFRVKEAEALLGEALALATSKGTRVRLLLQRQDARYRLGRDADSVADVREALALAKGSGDEWGVARALHALGYRAMLEGELDAAYELSTQGARAAAAVGDKELERYFSVPLGAIAVKRGDLARAVEIYGELSARSQEDGDTLGQLDALYGLAEVHLLEGAPERALQRLDAARPLAERRGQPYVTIVILELAAMASLRSGHARQAVRSFSEALQFRRDHDAEPAWTTPLGGLGMCLLELGRGEDAAALLGACERLAAEDPMLQADEMVHLAGRKEAIGLAQEELGAGSAGASTRLDGLALQAVVDVALGMAREVLADSRLQDSGVT